MTVKELIACLKSTDQTARMNAAAVLAAIGDEAAPAVPTLIDLLKSDDEKDQKLAAWTLGEIGPVAAKAIPVLLELAQEDDDVAEVAVAALENIDVIEEQAA